MKKKRKIYADEMKNDYMEFAGMPDFPSRARCSPYYKMFENSLKRLVMSNFKWYELDENQANAIEWNLVTTGMVGAVVTDFNLEKQIPDGLFIGLVGSIDNPVYDFYGYPNGIKVTGLNGKEYESTEKYAIGYDSMYRRPNMIMLPSIFTYVKTLAAELTDAYEMWKTAAETRKQGMIFTCPTKQSAELLKKILKTRSANDPYIVVENYDFADGTTVDFRPNTGNDLAQFHENFMNVWGHVLDLLGLENNSQNKKERMIVSEIELNRSLSRYLAADRLAARKAFAEKLSEITGKEIRVENYLASMITETPDEANVYGDSDIVSRNAEREVLS